MSASRVDRQNIKDSKTPNETIGSEETEEQKKKKKKKKKKEAHLATFAIVRDRTARLAQCT